MWCPNCQSEVAAAVDDADGCATCVSCGNDLGGVGADTADRPTVDTPVAPPRTAGTAEDRARELLDQWSHLFPGDEPDEVFAEAAPAPAPRPQAAAPPERGTPAATAAVPRPKHRVDRPAPAPSPAPAPPSAPPRAAGGPRIRVDAGHAGLHASAPVRPPHAAPADAPRVHAAHAAGPRRPHFDPSLAGDFGGPSRKANSTAALGQLLAYAGVLGLTVGGAFVVWSYFGGPPGYAPTGWLLTTGGQMLLFLGIVTLISGGMERTSHEVRTRIEYLGESIHRLEHGHAHALRSPHLPAERFAGEEQAATAERDAVSA